MVKPGQDRYRAHKRLAFITPNRRLIQSQQPGTGEAAAGTADVAFIPVLCS